MFSRHCLFHSAQRSRASAILRQSTGLENRHLHLCLSVRRGGHATIMATGSWGKLGYEVVDAFIIRLQGRLRCRLCHQAVPWIQQFTVDYSVVPT